MVSGPVTYMVVEFVGNKFKGEILPEIQALVDGGLIRVLDFTFVRKDEDGNVEAFEISDSSAEIQTDFGSMELAAQGLLGQADIADLAAVLQDDSSAGILVFENVWAAPFAESIVRAEGRWVLLESVPVDMMADALADMP